MKRITEIWWQKCLLDKQKIEHWLISLYNNELDAKERFLDFAEKYCQEDVESYKIFLEIAAQEAKHAILVENIIKNRGLTIYVKSSKTGRYWLQTLKCIEDKMTAAAIGAYAEGLSLKRMRIIINNVNTPVDLRELFKIIEPEESYHAKILQKIAKKYGMSKVRECHNKGLEALGLKIIISNR